VGRYLILARSVTYAQRMQHVLERFGMHCRIARAPRDLTEFGCAYILEIAGEDLPQAVAAIRREGFAPVRIFWHQNDNYQEVRL